jgi:hypothetical protein
MGFRCATRMSSETKSSAVLGQRSFVLFWCGRVAATGYQMLALLIGWQVYA